MAITVVLQAALWIWFLGCVTTWRIGKYLLVEGMGVRSAEFAMLCMYSAGLAAYWLFPPAGKWVLSSVLALWFTVQFFCHWYYTIFGASEQKLKGYNDCFWDTVRLLPVSERRLVPDMYHMILHALILLNLALCLL